MRVLERGDVVGTGVQELVVEECGSCGVLFAFPRTLREKALADHSRSFSCPNGHSLSYSGKTEAQNLKEQLEREREWSGRIAAERDQVEASLRATRGVVTRLKNRAKSGVCPVDGCHRHFENLERHIKSRHPGFDPAEAPAS